MLCSTRKAGRIIKFLTVRNIPDGERVNVRPAELLNLIVQLLDLFGELSRPVPSGA